MKTITGLVAALAIMALAASPASAQTQSRDQGVVVSVQGGGFNGVADLNDAGTADFATGFNVGAGAGYQFNRYLALRGTFSFARAEGRGLLFTPASGLTEAEFSRFYYGADLQVRAPLSGGVTPYVFGGGGAVTVRPDKAFDLDSFTKPAGKVGAGITFDIPGSNASVYAEATTWIFQWDRYGFDKTQYDVTWSGGVSFRFGR